MQAVDSTGHLRNGALIKNDEKLSEADFRKIQEIMVYIVKNHGENELPPAFLRSSYRMASDRKSTYEIEEKVRTFIENELGERSSTVVDKTKNSSFEFPTNQGHLNNSSIIIDVDNSIGKFYSETDKALYEVNLSERTAELILTKDGKDVLSWKMLDLINDLAAQKEYDKIIWHKMARTIEAHFVPRTLSISTPDGGETTYLLSGKLILHFL
jgi:hypothetical protein